MKSITCIEFGTVEQSRRIQEYFGKNYGTHWHGRNPDYIMNLKSGTIVDHKGIFLKSSNYPRDCNNCKLKNYFCVKFEYSKLFGCHKLEIKKDDIFW